MKHLLALMIGIAIPSSAARFECVRWTWNGDVYNRKAMCLEWRGQGTPAKTEKKQ